MRKIFANLQVLRAVAAGIVAHYHLQPMITASYGTAAGSHIGAFGVDIFFVISGFVMFISNHEMKAKAFPFIIGRFFRIIPLYWFSTFIMVGLYYLGFHPNGLIYFQPYMLAQSMFFITTSFPDGRQDLILSLGWTLIYELFFYFIFAVTLRMRTPGHSLAGVSAIFLLLVVIGMTVSHIPARIGFFLQPIILEFLFGGLLAVIVLRWPDQNNNDSKWGTPAAIFAIVAALSIVFALETTGWQVPGDSRAFVWGLPAMIIVGSLVVLETRGWVINSGSLLLLGSASYALYLFHPLAMQSTVKMVTKIPAVVQLGPGFAVLAALSAAVAVSIVVHLSIEVKFMAMGKCARGRTRQPFDHGPASLPAHEIKVSNSKS